MTDHGQRRACMEEIVNTEKTYVAHLELLQQFVAEPLAERLEQREGSGGGGGGGGGLLACCVPATPAFITPRNFETIFGAFPPVLAANRELCAQLAARLAAWGPAQTVGDVFAEWGHNLESAYLNYCRGYNKATRAFDTSMRSDGFANFIHDVQADALPCSVMGIMVSPVSRLARYVLILGSMRKRTGDDHPDAAALDTGIHRLESALEELQRAAFADSAKASRRKR